VNAHTPLPQVDNVQLRGWQTTIKLSVLPKKSISKPLLAVDTSCLTAPMKISSLYGILCRHFLDYANEKQFARRWRDILPNIAKCQAYPLTRTGFHRIYALDILSPISPHQRNDLLKQFVVKLFEEAQVPGSPMLNRSPRTSPSQVIHAGKFFFTEIICSSLPSSGPSIDLATLVHSIQSLVSALCIEGLDVAPARMITGGPSEPFKIYRFPPSDRPIETIQRAAAIVKDFTALQDLDGLMTSENSLSLLAVRELCNALVNKKSLKVSS
jgi:hypothetical protein